MTPVTRLGLAEEIAEAAARVISRAARFVTGSVLTVSTGAVGGEGGAAQRRQGCDRSVANPRSALARRR